MVGERAAADTLTREGKGFGEISLVGWFPGCVDNDTYIIGLDYFEVYKSIDQSVQHNSTRTVP